MVDELNLLETFYATRIFIRNVDLCLKNMVHTPIKLWLSCFAWYNVICDLKIQIVQTCDRTISGLLCAHIWFNQADVVFALIKFLFDMTREEIYGFMAIYRTHLHWIYETAMRFSLPGGINVWWNVRQIIKVEARCTCVLVDEICWSRVCNLL
jgi:hypothetical protein